MKLGTMVLLLFLAACARYATLGEYVAGEYCALDQVPLSDGTKVTAYLTPEDCDDLRNDLQPRRITDAEAEGLLVETPEGKKVSSCEALIKIRKVDAVIIVTDAECKAYEKRNGMWDPLQGGNVRPKRKKK